MIFLFRRQPRHIFISAQDPEYRYEILCGRCEFPLAPEDLQCPRCQSELEICPVCSEMNHTRAPLPRFKDGKPGTRCPVCRVHRVPFGERPVGELGGSFCSNLYGCSAGGLLLASNEFALLGPDASRCQICKHPVLSPLDVKTFLYHINRCLFCSTCFGDVSSWSKGWAGHGAVERLAEVGEASDVPCPLCGRNDWSELGGDGSRRLVSVGVGHDDDRHEISVGLYLRMAELGRVLSLYRGDKEAFDRCFDTWFDSAASTPSARDGFLSGVKVGEAVDKLLEGTLVPEIRSVLQERLSTFVAHWETKLRDGLSYRIQTGREMPIAPRHQGPQSPASVS